MNEELNDVVKTLRANGNRLTGEDGGMALSMLENHLKPTLYEEAGLVNYGMGQLCYLKLIVYVWGDYKFVVQEDIEKNVDMGGTIYHGTVDLYNNGDPR
jgi:hypothetical protein|tara:strand:+ start:1145 stop:1441 length:297 start_codon:yes stop_codon:yes gene_type:complete